uniref:Uncharacterized protein n=1 Tax=Piliocolobus tephrosceles TaxID=591936 RepID=A0A8C9HX64_9PRIM
MGEGASKQIFLCHISIFRGRTEGNPRIDLRMHKLDMSLAEKAPRFQCIHCTPLRSCSGPPCTHNREVGG